MDVISRPKQVLLVLIVLLCCGFQSQEDAKVLVTIELPYQKGPIQAELTDADVTLEYYSRGGREEPTPELRKKILDDLVDQELVNHYLIENQYVPDEKEVRAQVRLLRNMIDAAGQNPNQVFKQLGLNGARLNEKVSFASRWQKLVRENITADVVQKYFERNKVRFDGTEIHARQIVLLFPKDMPEEKREAETAKLTKRLKEIKSEIEDGKLKFAAAAKEYSEAPSATEGGDLGMFAYGIKNLRVIEDAVFALEDGEVSEPFASPFGVHIVTAVERRPGNFVLEDVRVKVERELQQKLFRSLVEQQRNRAKIEYHSP